MLTWRTGRKVRRRCFATAGLPSGGSAGAVHSQIGQPVSRESLLLQRKCNGYFLCKSYMRNELTEDKLCSMGSENGVGVELAKLHRPVTGQDGRACEIHATESYSSFSSLLESVAANKVLSESLHLCRCFLLSAQHIRGLVVVEIPVVLEQKAGVQPRWRRSWTGLGWKGQMLVSLAASRASLALVCSGQLPVQVLARGSG